MKLHRRIDRRRFIAGAAGGTSALLLGGCHRVLDSAESLTRRVQEAVAPRSAVSREYTEADLSPHFKSNGTHDPANPEYQALARDGFKDWRLALGGLVDRPMQLSLAEIHAMPSVTQITRQDCVEGWSCIGKWTGVPLGALLAPLGVQPKARYVMFYCFDTVEGASEPYYESIDIAEAAHPQTILAYAMNDRTLPIPYGAPLRLRLGNQLGYKMAKYLRGIELVESFSLIRGGSGGFYEDNGYEWYAGI